MLQNFLITPSHNKSYQIGTLVKGDGRNTGNSKAKLHRKRSILTMLILIMKPYKTFTSLSVSNFPFCIKLHQNRETKIK